jgi:hypothetical protein
MAQQIIKQLIMKEIKNYITKTIFFIFTIFLVSCSTNTQLEKEISEDQKIANYFANQLDSISKKNNVKYGHIIVNVDTTHKMKKPIIFYDPLIYPNENFVKEYTLYIIRSIDTNILNSIDSVIFETQLQDTTFCLKRYRGSTQEVFNLKEKYQPYGKDFDTLIEFIIKNNYVKAVSFISSLMKETNENNFNGKINWLNQSFLDYTKQIYLYKNDTVQNKIDKKIMNDFFYPMPMWYKKKDAFNLFNFVRKQLKMEELHFTLDDTLKYGIKPDWLIEMYSTSGNASPAPARKK